MEGKTVLLCSYHPGPNGGSSYHTHGNVLVVVVVVVVALTLTRMIKSVVTGQAPVTLELRNTPGKKHEQNQRWCTHISQLLVQSTRYMVVLIPLWCRYVHYRGKYRQCCSSDRHYSTYCHYWLLPYVQNDFTGTIEGRPALPSRYYKGTNTGSSRWSSG